MNDLILNNRKLSDFGVIVSGGGAYDGAQRDTTTVEVLGQAGSIIVDRGRWLPADLSYECGVVGADNMDAVRAFIMSLGVDEIRIEDTFHPNEYYWGRINSTIKPIASVNRNMFTFTLTFLRRPQRYLKAEYISENFTFTSNYANEIFHVNNPTIFKVPAVVTYQAESTGSTYIRQGTTGFTLIAASAGRYAVNGESWKASVNYGEVPLSSICTGSPYIYPSGETAITATAPGTVFVGASIYTL